MPRSTPFAVIVLGVFGIAALVVGLAIGGGATATGILDPGPFIRYGLPVVTTVSNLAAATTIGALAMIVLSLSADKPEYEWAARFASVAAAIWAVSAAAVVLLTFVRVTAGSIDPFGATFGPGLWQFVSDTGLGSALGLVVAFATVITMLVTASRSKWAMLASVVLGVCAMFAIAGTGHQAGAANHNLATSAMFLHILGAAVWIGGLILLVGLRRVVAPDRIRTLVERYSTFALMAFVVVAGSGIASASIRVDPADLGSPYGHLLIIKIVALLALGALGALNRVRSIRALPAAASFWWLVVCEVVLMGIASGTAVALGATATPIPEIIGGVTPAEILTGEPLPPPPDAWEYLFGTPKIDPLWLAVCGFGVFYYLVGAFRLRSRGDHWSVLRTISWISGMLTLLWVTNGGVARYSDVLFSGHMLGHMVLGMMVPVLLVFGAPVTLALRTIHKRDDSSLGPREWILLLVHSGYVRVIGNPYIAALIFVGSLWVFYNTDLLRFAVTNHLGHEWMIVHFLLSGYLFVQALIGIDPVPGRPAYPVRLMLLLGTMTAHAFFGLAIMTGTGLFVADWFGAMGWDIGISAIADQQRAGGIAWSIGEIPTLAVAVAVAVLWARNDDREQRRYDRKAERDGDAELIAYNKMLQGLSRRD